MAEERKSRKDGIAPSFDPVEGILVYLPVKEALQKMLDDGVFDSATSLVLGFSDSRSIETRQHGTYWECHALASLLSHRATRRFEDS